MNPIEMIYTVIMLILLLSFLFGGIAVGFRAAKENNPALGWLCFGLILVSVILLSNFQERWIFETNQKSSAKVEEPNEISLNDPSSLVEE